FFLDPVTYSNVRQFPREKWGWEKRNHLSFEQIHFRLSLWPLTGLSCEGYPIAFAHTIRTQCAIYGSARMSALGLGRVKTPTPAPRVETFWENCALRELMILQTCGWMLYWRIVFSTFFQCMSFYTASVNRYRA